jgi:broad-specificity NMP kinase
MKDLIIIHGAPGVGKTTIGRILKRKMNGVLLDLDWIRSKHLDDAWTNCSPVEEEMSYRILLRTIGEYISHGYKDILLNTSDIVRLMSHDAFFRSIDYRIITLTAADGELSRRVVDPKRDSGWRNAKGSVARNKVIVDRPMLPHEVRIDTTDLSPDSTALEIISIMNRVTAGE